MNISKVVFASFALSVVAMVSGCATDVGENGAPAGTEEEAAAESGVDSEAADDSSAVGRTSSAMTSLAVCASGTDPNALGNLQSVGAFEEYKRTKATIDFCTLGSLDRRETIVDFNVASWPAHKYEFIAKSGNPYAPKDFVQCGGQLLVASLQKWDSATSKFVQIGAKITKSGTWSGPFVGGHCVVPSHVFTRVNMVDSSTIGGETTKYRVVMKTERLGGQAEDAYVRGRNLGSGY